MMGGEAPETCWATPKRQVINLGNCCILLVDLFEWIELNVADLFCLSVIIFQHDPKECWCSSSILTQIQICLQSGCCICNSSISSLRWNRRPSTPCCSCPNKWSVMRWDLLVWLCVFTQCVSNTRLIAVVSLGLVGNLPCCLCCWSSTWNASDSTIVRKWKWLSCNVRARFQNF